MADREDVQIRTPTLTLLGNLDVPPDARGIVIFAHGSGSSRRSPRNRQVAGELVKAHLATLLVDLLTASEEVQDNLTARLRFDINLLAERVMAVTDWVAEHSDFKSLPIGYFGASTGAAAALVAAADWPRQVHAIVSRGGRPDLARTALARVQAPTLLIVGGDDLPVIEMNRRALEQLQGIKALEIVPEATHLFEEPGTLERVAELAREWLVKYLP